jgi:hypothetical protein
MSESVKTNASLNSIEIPFKSAYYIEIFQKYIQEVFPQKIRDNIIFDENKRVLSTKDGKSLKEMIGQIYEYNGKGTLHLRYTETIKKLEEKYGVPS